MKKLVSVILTLAMALTFVLPAVAEDTVKVGVIGPMTGPAAIYGTAVANGAKIAADEITRWAASKSRWTFRMTSTTPRRPLTLITPYWTAARR